MISKIKYYVKRLATMNFKAFFETADMVKEKTNRNKFLICLDMIWCSLRYGAGHYDYRCFEMYNMNKIERNKILTVGRNASLIRTLNEKKARDTFEDKAAFSEIFKKYMHRECMKLDNNYDTFKEFIKDKDYIMAKPLDGTCGKGVEKIKIDKKNSKKLYNRLVKDKHVVVEEVAKQCEEMAKLHKDSINTIRVTTLINNNNKFNVVWACARMGNHGSCVDNFNSGGMSCPIDVKTGKIISYATDKDNICYEVHPISKVKLIGYQIPQWKKVLKLVEEASKVMPEVRYVGWDVCIGEDGPFLIEGNGYPGNDLGQRPKEHIGTYDIMLDMLDK